jgi:hypothetical protein
MQNTHHVDLTSFFPAKNQLGIVASAQLALHQHYAEAVEDV